MAKYLFKSNVYAQLSEIVEADSEKEVMDKIRKQESFEIKQEVLRLYPSSIEIRKIKEKKEKNNMELIKQALIERDRKIYGLQQHNRNLEDKLGRIGGYHYGNPKQ